jgi:glutathione synthase/RimK-type ligase-like ATP-grasp enzyme
MTYTIAIHPDDYTNPVTPDKYDASSPRWAELIEKAGHKVKWVSVKHADILSQLQDCDAFMWRWAHFSGMGRIARRLLPVIEKSLGILVYPSQATCWHYDDKVAQFFLFEAHDIPAPKTWTWFDSAAAKSWAATAQYPLVLKLAAGAGSTNVKLVSHARDACAWIDRLFSQRLASLDESQLQPYKTKQRFEIAAQMILCGNKPIFLDDGYEVQSGYVYFQEFLPGNAFDTRVTVIGKRAFAFRRFNRDDDFRASGSGKIDHDPAAIDKKFVALAFEVAQKLGTQSCAIDGLYRHGQPVVGEISYTYASWAVQACPGHWDADLNWHTGHMWPEEGQVEDFLRLLAKTKGH